MSPTFRHWLSLDLKGSRLLPAGSYVPLVLGIALCMASVAYAQTGAAPATTGTSTTTSTTASTTGTGTATTTTKAKGHKGAKHCTYSGTVASVDATAKSFVVHPKKGEDVTLKVNDKTKYSPKGKTWDDVKADAKVIGTCKKDGADTWGVTIKFAAEKKATAATGSGDTGHGPWPGTGTGHEDGGQHRWPPLKTG